MRTLEVYKNKELAGILTEESSNSYTFKYTDAWFANPQKAAISLTIPKTQQTHTSQYLFPFFFNMLSEGANRKLQNRSFKIDENDHFGLLAATARFDTIGSVTVKPVAP